ncbi:OLC1v1037295C1 [Oldenlandia corymbosa var. corymbosa]|uniref:OLC1v1037295C1 n=1 Tax=Oldenlandia corymbosa var. corymbosa TaxID=529605 RepID=A0AAV1D0K0_OLDCO|nr:OLC1v1037295C1 [Oldenlandia corymbosa var. corymbosa]
MILRATLSNTKKFFQKSVENFKSFLSGGYQRLPKSSPCHSFPCGGGAGGAGGGSIHDHHHQVKYSRTYEELGKFKTECLNDQQANKLGSRTASKKKDAFKAAEIHQADQSKENQRKKKIVYEGKRFYQDYARPTNRMLKEKEKSTYLVAKKLKDLEMLDNGNVEHVLDIEEVLHYYSRLTLPAYVDIVDQFFTDMYSELLNGQSSTVTSKLKSSSRPMLQRFGF